VVGEGGAYFVSQVRMRGDPIFWVRRLTVRLGLQVGGDDLVDSLVGHGVTPRRAFSRAAVSKRSRERSGARENEGVQHDLPLATLDLLAAVVARLSGLALAVGILRRGVPEPGGPLEFPPLSLITWPAPRPGVVST
jgi:hypothetical protein